MSKSIGTQPRWRRDGKELFYLEGAARFQFMAARITVGKGGICEIHESMPLFERLIKSASPVFNSFTYSPSEDGQRFLVNHHPEGFQETLNVIINWQKAEAAKSP